MVSKVAVIAAVVIIAAPIVLGFALNLTETSRTEYEQSNDSVNVTPLLVNDVGFTTAIADTYQLNTNFKLNSETGQRLYPLYIESDAGVKSTAFPYLSRYVTWSTGQAFNVNSFSQYYFSASLTPSSAGYMTLQISLNGTVVETINRISTLFYDKAAGTMQYRDYDTNGTYHTRTIDVDANSRFAFTLNNLTSVQVAYGVLYENPTALNRFTDLSAGFYFPRLEYNRPIARWVATLPADTTSLVYTINLNSITLPNYTIIFNTILNNTNSVKLDKTTTNGVVTWKMTNDPGTPNEKVQTLYYNPSITDNTYQIYVTQTNEDRIDSTTIKYYYHLEARYAGHWPKVMCLSNYYQKYEYDYDITSSDGNGLRYLRVYVPDVYNYTRTPTMRIDAAAFKAFEFDVIQNNTYSPASFKTNPSTTITSISNYGTSLEFAGNIYNVKDGKITIDSHDVPIDKLVFKSVPNGNRFDNMIGNTLISTSNAPSTIKFNGQWAADVKTSSTEQITINDVEWNAGKFAWDGIDINFLLVGILAAFGAVVGLGIYAKNRRMSIIPLLIVCGCAGMIFMMMI